MREALGSHAAVNSSWPAMTDVKTAVNPAAQTEIAADDRLRQRRLLWLALALFLSYLAVGLPLPVISLFVRHQLGFGDAMSGLAVGVAFLSTILTRNYAGRLADQRGGKACMLRGLLLYALASAVCLLSGWAVVGAPVSYAVLILGRLLLGLGESLTLIGMLSWSIGLAHASRTGRVMAIVGAAMYGAFALGSPVGLALFTHLGLVGLMAVCALLPLLGLVMVRGVPGVAPHAGARESFVRILGRIWVPGAAVALQGIGFAALGAFGSLYFLTRGWPHAGLALTFFGGGFVAVRLLCGHLPDRVGGAKVALGSLLIEACGQYLLWLAPNPTLALVGALLTGAGCSMVFPAMGVEVVKRVPPQLRGTAMGGFAAFQDLAYGLTGPIAGLFTGTFGYPVAFLIGGVAASVGVVTTLFMVQGGRPGR